MKSFFSTIFILLIITQLSYSQNLQKGSYYCWDKKMHGPEMMAFSNTGAYNFDSPNVPKHKYDVLDYKINVDIRSCFLSPFPRTFNGSVIISFRVDTALSVIDLHAVNTSLQINAVSINGISFTHSNNQLLVTLNRVYNPGEIATVKIDYQHLNVSDAAFYVSNGFVFTDCEPEGARKWFPCYDRPSDKATVELTAKVPPTVRLGSNGKLVDSTLTGDTLIYHWKSRDKIPTYLIVISAKVNYQLDIMNWINPLNSNDTVPIRFYYNSGENPAPVKNVMFDMMTHFSQKFGPHPFEKNGFATLNSQFTWGGMENQTLTSLCPGCWQVNLASHEFAHQWYGDAVTCGTWGDIWLNEGFATYAEAVWYEHTSGYTAYKQDIISDANSYFSGNPGWAMYRPEWAVTTPPNSQLFNYAITYAKGACVLHMLRYTIGDSIFFNAIKAYAMDTVNFRYNSAVTDDFTTKLNQSTGQDLSWFINNWVKQPNHPVYANTYNFMSLGGGNWLVGFMAKQTQTNSTFHPMPLTLKITFATGSDTLIRVMNDVNNQSFFWTFARQPLTFTFDPNNDIVLKQGATTVSIVPELEVPNVFELHQNYPNPFNPTTKIRYDIPEQSLVTLTIYDATGKEITKLVNEIKRAGKHWELFNANGLASGIYYYTIKAGNYSNTRKMVLVK